MVPLVRRLRTRLARAYVAARIARTQPFAPPRLVHEGPAAPTAGTPARAVADLATAAGDARFDAARAFSLLEEQCRIGPRIPGSAGHRRTRELLLTHLSTHARRVALQEWEQRIFRGPGAGTTVPLCNLLALFPGREEQDLPPDRIRPALMLAAHWDTRPVADSDPDPARRSDPVPGANDGASGIAVLLELARLLALEPPPVSVVIACFDGEDLGEYYYGSRYFARWAGHPALAPWRPSRAVVVDMVGGRGLACTRELNSLENAPELWDEAQACARALGLEASFGGAPRRITDDHVMLGRAGIPAIVLIDYSYPFWHTVGDTPERCAPQSLEAVGRVLQRLVMGQPVAGVAPAAGAQR